MTLETNHRDHFWELNKIRLVEIKSNNFVEESQGLVERIKKNEMGWTKKISKDIISRIDLRSS